MSDSAFETISLDDLNTVNGGDFLGDLWDAGVGAARIVASPVTATINGVDGTVRALRQGHSVGDSLANGLVRAAQIPNTPDLGNIPAR